MEFLIEYGINKDMLIGIGIGICLTIVIVVGFGYYLFNNVSFFR